MRVLSEVKLKGKSQKTHYLACLVAPWNIPFIKLSLSDITPSLIIAKSIFSGGNEIC